MFQPGDIISYVEMCKEEGLSLQRGMNFRVRGPVSLILMSRRRGAPYTDTVEDGGKTLIYEGHDVPRTREFPEPKKVDQPEYSSSGRLTQNGLFWKAVGEYKEGHAPAAHVRVYGKIQTGIWTYAGMFELLDGWMQEENGRRTFKFRLQVLDRLADSPRDEHHDIAHNRLVPANVKMEVWKRDKGKCVLCGSQKNLHFDHDVPFSKGGTSLLAKNIRLLCAKHNLQKRDKIE
jgi:hypothetical protein